MRNTSAAGSYLLVIAAAGFASRAFTLTGFGAKKKCLVNAGVDGATVLEEITREAAASGIDDCVIVTSAARDPAILARFFDPTAEDPSLGEYLQIRSKTPELAQLAARPKFRIRYVHQAEPRGFGEAVALTHPYATGAAQDGSPYSGIAVALGDDLVHARVPATAQLISAHRATGHMTIAVQEVSRDDARKYGVVRVEPEPVRLGDGFLGTRAFRIVDVEEKPDDPQPNWIGGEEVYLAIVGRYVLNVEDVEFLTTGSGTLKKELDFTTLLRRNIERERLIGVDLDGTWHSVGDPTSAQQAYIHYALVPPNGERTPSQKSLIAYVRRLLEENE